MNKQERFDKAIELLIQLEKWAESPDPVVSPPNPPGLSDWPPIPPRRVVLNQVRVIKHLLVDDKQGGRMKTSVYKMEFMVIDHDNIGLESIREVIENTRYPNWCISPKLIYADGRTIDWSDDHPLNNSNTALEEYDRLFRPDQ